MSETLFVLKAAQLGGSCRRWVVEYTPLQLIGEDSDASTPRPLEVCTRSMELEEKIRVGLCGISEETLELLIP